MTVTATQTIADAQAAATANSTVKTQTKTSSQILSGNYDTFIKLLTTQLQNQDPLQPTDTAAFTQQLVQYSQVEQQISTNTKLDAISAALTKGAAGQYVDYIGKTVAASSKSLVLAKTSDTTSAANISYTLPDAATSVKINIKDSSGAVVATIPGKTAVGDHNATWDGKSKDGTQMANGTYTFEVTATTSSGDAMKDIKQYYVGPVTAVTSSSGAAQLEMNGAIRVSPDDVIAIGS